MASKRCIGCGKVMPRRATDKGWTLTHFGGKGARWYRQCGCLHRRVFHALADDLFYAKRDLPHRFPTTGVVAVPEQSQVEGD